MADTKDTGGASVQPVQNITFVVSDDKNPKLQVSPNTRVELVEIGFEDPDRNKKDGVVLATLCGYGSSYCVALIEY